MLAMYGYCECLNDDCSCVIFYSIYLYYIIIYYIGYKIATLGIIFIQTRICYTLIHVHTALG